jgi:hypothetical protein
MLRLGVVLVVLSAMPVHAEKSFFVYQNWLRLDENARTAYIAETIDTLSNINFDDAALIAGEHYSLHPEVQDVCRSAHQKRERVRQG